MSHDSATERAEEAVSRLVAAFRAKDAEAFAELFTEEAEFVDITGVQVSQRQAIREIHAKLFADIMPGSRFDGAVTDARRLADTVVLCHATWTMMPNRVPGAASVPPVCGLLTLVLVSCGPRSRIAAATNVRTTRVQISGVA